MPIENVRGELTSDYQFQVEGEGFNVTRTPEGLVITNPRPADPDSPPQVRIARITIIPNTLADLDVSREFTVVDFPFFNTQMLLQGPDGEEVKIDLGKYAPDFNFGIARRVEGTSFSANDPFSARLTSKFIVPQRLPYVVFLIQSDGVLSGALDGKPIFSKSKPSEWFDTGYTVLDLPPGEHELEISYIHRAFDTPAILRVFPVPLDENGVSQSERESLEKVEGDMIMERGAWQPARGRKPRTSSDLSGFLFQSSARR
jgi:hypothetical protein